jgi:hypothetical protein
MIRFNSYKNFKDIRNKNKVSIIYAVENNSKTTKIENLIDIILAKKIALFSSLLKKLSIVADTQFLVMILTKPTRLKIIKFLLIIKE